MPSAARMPTTGGFFSANDIAPGRMAFASPAYSSLLPLQTASRLAQSFLAPFLQHSTELFLDRITSIHGLPPTFKYLF